MKYNEENTKKFINALRKGGSVKLDVDGIYVEMKNQKLPIIPSTIRGALVTTKLHRVYIPIRKEGELFICGGKHPVQKRAWTL